MKTLVTYLDESGKAEDPNHRCITVAGFRADAETWLGFEQRWLEILGRHGASYFHCREAAHRVGHYRGWSPDKVSALYFELIDAICETVDLAVACVVDISAHRDIFCGEQRASSVADPYHLALRTCISHIVGCGLPEEQRLVFIVDQIDQHAIALDLFDQTTGQLPDFEGVDAPLRFQNSRNTPALQAADVLAWETNLRAERFLADSNRSRKSFEAICLRIPFIDHFRGRDDLVALRNACSVSG